MLLAGSTGMAIDSSLEESGHELDLTRYLKSY